MSFFYPNYINDHWRLLGEIFFQNREYFVDPSHKTFRLAEIQSFLQEKGIGYYDTATVIRRLKANASDQFLEIVTPTDIPLLVRPLHALRVIVTTGQLATETLCQSLHISQCPQVGQWVNIENLNQQVNFSENIVEAGFSKPISLYRLPSSSRAYPLPFFQKAEAYRKMFAFAGLL